MRVQLYKIKKDHPETNKEYYISGTSDNGATQNIVVHQYTDKVPTDNEKAGLGFVSLEAFLNLFSPCGEVTIRYWGT